MRLGKAAALLAVALAVTGCAAGAADGGEITHGSLEQTQLELRVIEAVGSTRPAGARYIPSERTVYLTLYVRDDPITDGEIERAQAAAEAAVEHQGTEVVVELNDGPPPVLAPDHQP